MVFPAKPTASQEAKPYQVPRPVLTRCYYKVLRALPDTLPSAPFLPAAQFKYWYSAHASFFAPRSYPSIWLTNISPTSYDELRSHPRTAPDADPDHDCRVPRSAQWRPPGSATPAFRRRQSQCGDYNRHSLALGGAHH